MATKGKKAKISKVKRNNQTRNKLVKQGKIKSKRNKKQLLKNVTPIGTDKVQQEYSDSEESDHGQGMLEMVEKEDLAFLKKTIADRSNSYSLLKKIRFMNTDPDSNIEKPRRKRKIDCVEDELEAEYEEQEGTNKDNSKRTKHLLPIKTKKGLVMRSIEEDFKEEINADEQFETAEENEENKDSDEEFLEVVNTEEVDVTRPMTTVELLVKRQIELQKQKFRIGILCSGLLESPEAKIKNFYDLLGLMDARKNDNENLLTVRKLAAVSILEVFKDILPEYEIKHQESNVKLKKDTLQLQKFEDSLLSHYKKYLQKLEKMVSTINKKAGDTRKSTPQEVKLGEIAIRCLSDLLTTHPYFNFSKNVAKMLVPFLDHRLPTVRSVVSECCKNVFKNDKKGEISLALVRSINHLVKSRSHDVQVEVLETLLSLRIRDVNLDAEKEAEIKQKKFMTHKQKLLKLSKRERKRNKKLEELEKEMLETKAEENKNSKQQLLTEITKIVFTIYFRILKKAPNSKLLSVTLEGLAKFANVINLEFYSDLVDVLDALIQTEDENQKPLLGYREQLHCVQTVFTILSGQADVLNIDPLRFYTHLYRNLMVVNAGKNHEDLRIILKTLSHVLIKRRKKISQQRLLAFLKRLATMSLQVQHNGALACLGIIKNVMQLTKSADLLLDLDTSVGSGRYDPELMEPEYCNAGSTALYELRLASKHYHPTVRKMAAHISAGVPASGDGSLNPEIGKLNPEELFTEFDGSQMCFKPAIPVPKKTTGKLHPGRYLFTNSELDKYCKTVASKDNLGPFDFARDIDEH